MTYFDDMTALISLKDDFEEAKIAFTWIFEKYYDQLYLHAKTFVRNYADAEDLVHIVLWVLWEKREIINITTSLQGYLYKSVQNTCLKFLEYKEVRKNYTNSVHENSNSSRIYDHNDPETILTAKERTDEIENSIAALPEQCRKVLMLWADGYSYQEIADLICITIGTVRTHLTRGKNKLREVYAKL